ncbi:Arv1-like family-domain-containing protein [Suillus clintonianus]|uniref:Arv1-like family-domain-containing protein n=1 Tax=Suillus clintonianus TaxID=1904413 RepID=UPI001B85F086|nr:Arv1-like family-domain-containing protein [Suillus clintonianus]KAG2132960.1 Arv1-like family-domain-containing protein [Suillus clintonianus]
MPICITCTHSISHLYTVYESAYNLRLEQCSKCLKFADPYVEHDSLTLLLDLILLKREVYRHLIYNRGTEPRKSLRKSKTGLEESQEDEHKLAATKNRQREKDRWWLILKLACGLITVDAFIRWAQLNPEISADVSRWTVETNIIFLRILVGCLIETIAFHGGVMFASRILPIEISGVRQQFKFSLIPLTIFYSSLTKLFLLFLLTIWRPSASKPGGSPYYWDPSYYSSSLVTHALEIWDEDKLDREWVVRNVLGGMATGFGLRVVLDCHPVFTTVVILVGWLAKTVVAGLLKNWVGGDEYSGDQWMAYSIP